MTTAANVSGTITDVRGPLVEVRIDSAEVAQIGVRLNAEGTDAGWLVTIAVLSASEVRCVQMGAPLSVGTTVTDQGNRALKELDDAVFAELVRALAASRPAPTDDVIETAVWCRYKDALETVRELTRDATFWELVAARAYRAAEARFKQSEAERLSVLGAEERLLVQRVRKIEAYFTQGFHVAEEFTGVPATSVSREQTVQTVADLLDGNLDHVDERSLHYIDGQHRGLNGRP
jgi:F0F1-type ATP synthase beta subunit